MACTVMTECDAAVTAARAAGAYLLKARDGLIFIQGSRDSSAPPTTEQDRESERLITRSLQEAFPRYGFLGEELGEQGEAIAGRWIVDPIDGTNNYVGGRDTFSVSIALERGGDIVLGVVYLPQRDELFVAERGGGATLNGTPIRVRACRDLTTASVIYSAYPGHEDLFAAVHERVAKAIPHLRLLGHQVVDSVDPEFGRGSMAAELCYLACGRLDGLLRFAQKPWDVAAGSVIAAEAGAAMIGLDNQPCSIYVGDYIAASPALLPQLTALVL